VLETAGGRFGAPTIVDLLELELLDRGKPK
jgi:hypothetical protein